MLAPTPLEKQLQACLDDIRGKQGVSEMNNPKAFRVWFKSDSACLIMADTHREACLKATYQARANETNEGTDRNSKEWALHTQVVRTECLDGGGETKWTAKEVRELILKQIEEQEVFESQLVDG